jgi:hypothetical protein
MKGGIMKRKAPFVVVILLVLAAGFTLGIGYAQKSKSGESPLSKYLYPVKITMMDWILSRIETDTKIGQMIYFSSNPESNPVFLWKIYYNSDKHKIVALFNVSTDHFEKKTAVKKREFERSVGRHAFLAKISYA